MSSRTLLLIGLAAPGAELLSIAVMITVLGWLATIALLVLGGVLGLSMLREAIREALQNWREHGRQTDFIGWISGQLPSRLLAAVLLIIPGFLSDVLAIILLVSGRKSLGFFTPQTDPSGGVIDLDRSSYHHLDTDDYRRTR